MVPSKKELNQIIRNKDKEKVQRQENYRLAFLIRREKEEKCFSFREKINNVVGSNIEWLGNTIDINWAKASYNLELHYLKQAISNEVYLKQSLINDGLSEDMIKEIMELGRYIKDDKILKELEEKRTKEENASEGTN